MIDRLRDIDEADDLQEAASDELCDLYANALLNLVVSVVVPVFNEEKGVGGLLEGLKRLGEGGGEGVDLLDVVIVDGGSEDGTVGAVHDWVNELISSSSSSSSSSFSSSQPFSLPSPFFRLQVVTSPLRGRGHQMNFGATHCVSPLILFLHADTHLREGLFIILLFYFILFNFI